MPKSSSMKIDLNSKEDRLLLEEYFAKRHTIDGVVEVPHIPQRPKGARVTKKPEIEPEVERRKARVTKKPEVEPEVEPEPEVERRKARVTKKPEVEPEVEPEPEVERRKARVTKKKTEPEARMVKPEPEPEPRRTQPNNFHIGGLYF